MRTLTLATVALLMVAATAQAGPLNPAHVPAGAKWVCHVDFEQMRATKLAAACRKEIQKHEKFQSKIKEATEKLGMNPMKDFLGVTLYDTGYAKDQGVVLIHCNKLDRKKLSAIFNKKHPDHKTSKYGKWTLSTWTDKRRGREHTVTGAFADDNTIALSGDAGKLKKALDLMSGKGKSLGKDAKLLAGVGKKPIFAVRAIDIDPEFLKKARCPANIKVTDVTIVWSESKGNLVGQYAISTDSDDTAKSLKAIVDGFKGLASLKFGSDKLASKLIGGLSTKAAGKTLNVTYKAQSGDLIAAAKKIKAMKKKCRDHRHHKHDKKSKKEEI